MMQPVGRVSKHKTKDQATQASPEIPILSKSSRISTDLHRQEVLTTLHYFLNLLFYNHKTLQLLITRLLCTLAGFHKK